tara:strand:- start:8438 stop:9013 length:576 start_codon:yes stop_codon:yes gene_type:complete
VRKLFLSLLVVSLVACAGTPAPVVKQYLLRSDSDETAMYQDKIADVTLGKVSVAAYLDHPSLVLQLADGSMSRAHHHLWAEPLRESLRIYMSRELSKRSGRSIRAKSNHQSGRYTTTTINIDIDELHGDYLGNVRLVAGWSLVDSDSQTILKEQYFVSETKLTQDGFGALVAAEERLLQEFSQEIADSLPR